MSTLKQIVILLSLIPTTAIGQWKKIFDFASPVKSIFFFDSVSKPITGFVGTANSKLWRTFDSGASWQQVSFPPNSNGIYSIPYSFAFKNRFEGWFSDFFSQNSSIYRTLDGGNTWVPLAPGPTCGIYYVPSTGYLICPYISPTYSYSTDGANFVTQTIVGIKYTVGVEFSDDYHGILTAATTEQNILYTNDGGMNWNLTIMDNEFFQPLGIKGTTTFFAMNEQSTTGNANRIFRSDDGGKTWQQIYQYHDISNFKTTGSLRYGANLSLYFQTVDDNSEGMMMSEDTGNSFFSICGPQNYFDTHFYVRDSFIYAGDKYGGLWLNTTGIGSNSIPSLSKEQTIITATDCRLTEDTITFTFFDSCNGRQAGLLDASITGSSRLQAITGTIPRTIQPNDTVRILYLPDTLASSNDSGVLHLKFKLGWKEFDTTITIIAHGYDPLKLLASSFSPDTLRFTALSCDSLKKAIHFTVIDTCQNEYARLSNVSFTGSTAFSASEALPRPTFANDSVIVSYHPESFYGDTSFMQLRYDIEGISFDTMIALIGDYVPSRISLSPKLSDTSLSLFANGCDPGNATLYFTFFDSCTNQGGTLVSAVPGTNDFTVGGSFPKATVSNDSLQISYNGSSDSNRTKLDLHFRIGSYDYDTTITLLGKGSNKKETVGFSLSGSQQSAKAGETTTIAISPTRTISNKGLNEISFDIIYNGDVLGLPQASGGGGLSVSQGAETRAGKFATLPIKITGNDISLDSMQALASVKFFVYLSDSTSTPIALGNMHLNKTDPDYERCTLSATTDSTRLQVDLLCGDSIIVEYMRGHGLPLRIVSLKPNPAQNELAIELDAAEGGVVAMEIYDELGKRVMRREVTFAKGRQQVTITTADLPEGMYSVRMGNVSGRFVKVQ